MSTTGRRACARARLCSGARPIECEARSHEVSDERQAPCRQVLASDPNKGEPKSCGDDGRRHPDSHDEGCWNLKEAPSGCTTNEEIGEFQRTAARHDAVLDLQLH